MTISEPNYYPSLPQGNFRSFVILKDVKNYISIVSCIGKEFLVSVIDKALTKFKKPKHFVCYSDPCLNPVVLPFYSSISFKISKILSRFGFKVPFIPVNKINFFFLLKILFLLRTGVTSILFHVLLVILVISNMETAES